MFDKRIKFDKMVRKINVVFKFFCNIRRIIIGNVIKLNNFSNF